MDGPGLQRFARQMQNCELTLDKMGWSEDLNNGETLLRPVDRLITSVYAASVSRESRVDIKDGKTSTVISICAR